MSRVKVIAIGNRIMGDDGIALRVAENLAEKLSRRGIEVIIGETDVEYCISKIEDNDLLFILDASAWGIEVGTVTISLLNQEYSHTGMCYSQHQPGLIHWLKVYGKKTQGYIIAIEAAEIEFGLNLSKSLEEKFAKICNQVYEQIIQRVGGSKMHDTFLMEKISTSLLEICEANKIRKIEKLALVTGMDSHLNIPGLYQHLLTYNDAIISEEIQIDITRCEMDDHTAIIESVEGEMLV